MKEDQPASNDAKVDGVETSAFHCCGCQIRLIDMAGGGLSARIREAIPSESANGFAAGAVSVSYAIAYREPDDATGCSGYHVDRDAIKAFEGPSEESVFRWLRQDIERTVAQSSRMRLFVHAGVVAWRGLAIVITGRSFSGKSTLVAELVRRGAVYYSDEFAILDDEGKVHPYARPLVFRDSQQQPADLRLLPEGTTRVPISIGLIVSAHYQPGVTWHPRVVRGARAVLPLIDGTVLAREESEAVLRIAARVAPTVVTLQGPRGEAAEVAPRLLDLVDDVLVSQALKMPDEGISLDWSDEMATVAELRLRSQTARPAPTFRRLQAARYVRIPDFLPPDEHRQVLEFALAHQDAFRDSGVLSKEGRQRQDYGARKSQTLYSEIESIWNLFDRRLRAMLSHVRKELGIPWFPLGEIERQISVHEGGGFFVPHVDTGHPMVANRRISCVFHFHSTPRRFTGGELKLYDTWLMNQSSTAAASQTTLMPLDNSLVFFPSDAFHEVCPVQRETDHFGDSRFAITIWFREGQWPLYITGANTAEMPAR
jgi:Rps23 Pro-64 3,4-dihydroxylase Tpa1-like proline 4-hydroxylase